LHDRGRNTRWRSTACLPNAGQSEHDDGRHNTFLQALGSPKGPAGRCLQLALDGPVSLFVSPVVLDELRKLTSRPKVIAKLKRVADRVEVLQVLISICDRQHLSAPPFCHHFCRPGRVVPFRAGCKPHLQNLNLLLQKLSPCV
jgi:hypothetical protein